MPGLGVSFGRGAATTFQQDLENSDCIVIMGSNMAEAHPVGFRWPMKARARGAKLIHVDPRYTRTSALCDQYAPIRAGTDIAFLGGLINYVVYPEEGRNRARERKRDPNNYLNPEWGFAWPHNRRILYNRASADPEGRPWSERKKYVWWDERQKKWTGFDAPDFEPDKPPSYRPAEDAKGMDAIAGDSPFIMKPDGKGWLFAPAGTKDGIEPACAKACPTDSIQFGPVDELRERARRRVDELRERGQTDAYLYGAEPAGEYGALNAFFLLTDHPSIYNLPEAPRRPKAHLKASRQVRF